MQLSEEEKAQTERYNAAYVQGQLQLMGDINRHVCGCDYGATSWTTQREADWIGRILGLSEGGCLLDLGSGAGWPAVYFAKVFGCDAVMVDLPQDGLRIAMERAGRDGVAARCRTLEADAAAIPLPDAGFEMIHHADLLCCLVRKCEVLGECRRVARTGARMVFTVISVAPGLSDEDYERASFLGPEFIESEAGYKNMLADTGWKLEVVHDLTGEFLRSTRRKMEIFKKERAALVGLQGEAEVARAQATCRARIGVLSDRHLLREMFVVRAL